ncbi:hypothetical protein CTA1_11821 [Colletotrichum tanaceti]|uniref:FAD-binding PCMH-type domain-containing protein n=1 Tax=Colletotrichum tanaceti TaxID=1306861 RepID=A0A4U6XAQ5_9PEZI|nr:hypothetical protein CTA1_11821 [Colletotrichum tanaceti]
MADRTLGDFSSSLEVIHSTATKKARYKRNYCSAVSLEVDDSFKFTVKTYFRAALVAQSLIALAKSASTLDSLTSCLSAASVAVAPSLPVAYNVRLPRTPLAVAIPTTTAQISSAVKCGAQNGVSVSAKSGGHSYTSSGFGGGDGHLVINLDRMYAVKVAADGTAKVQAGARLGHVATELYKQGKSIGMGMLEVSWWSISASNPISKSPPAPWLLALAGGGIRRATLFTHEMLECGHCHHDCQAIATGRG